MQSHEHQAGESSEHELYSHEFHDIHAEHAHEDHVCNSTCEHHQAAQHIDFMEPVERHDHSHEHGEKHVHGPGCGHVGYEQALFQVDQGKEKSHFHDPHEEHVHGPNCGHMEYQHVYTEIDKPHIHDEHCGHLDRHKAAEHIDQGKEHKHDEHADHADYHEEKHFHGPGCGHIEYEEAHKHVDESPTLQANVEHAAGDAEAYTDSHVEVATRQVEEVSRVQQTEAMTHVASGAVSAQEVSNNIEAVPEVKPAAAVASEASDPSSTDEAVIARLHEQAAADADMMRAEEEPTNLVNETIDQTLSMEPQQPIEMLDADAIAPTDEFEITDLSGESDDALYVEVRLTFPDKEPSLELGSGTLFSDESFKTGDETLADLVPAEVGNTLDSTLESLSDTPAGEGPAQELGEMTGSTIAEQRLDFSHFGNGQVPEVYNVEWPVLAEVSDDELESMMDTTRTYIARLIEQASEIDPSELEAISDQLIAMLQNMPRESAEELLPLLEELTELYDLPKLEKLLELYFAGHYQDQNMFTRIFGSTGQDTQDITTRLGQVVLELLKATNKHLQNNAV